MRGYEALAAGYFAFLAIAALTARARAADRVSAALAALALCGIVFAAASYGADLLRAWLPHIYLVTGYWLPGILAGAARHPTAFERWLEKTDAALRSGRQRLPPPLEHVTELAYLVCYPLVPAAFAVVWIAGSGPDVERFWLAVLLAGYACYATLPWLISRPPRLASTHTPKAIAAVNVFVLGRVSHQLNTFPSGHVAVSLAAAAAVASVSAAAGALVFVVAIAIALGAVSGRYHYVIDVWLGVVVAGAAAAIALI